MKKVVFFLGLCSFMLFSASATIRYVKEGGSGTCSGTSWANASDNLQLMIQQSNTGDQIWVAKGIYKPKYYLGELIQSGVLYLGGSTSSFRLKGGVKIYGGFAGNETSLSQRNIKNNETILKASQPRYRDACYHVVVAIGSLKTACLDGFTITGGRAIKDGETILPRPTTHIPHNSGGGDIYNQLYDYNRKCHTKR